MSKSPLGIAIGCFVALMLGAGVVNSQGTKGKKAPDPEKIAGTVTEVEKKGKSAALTIEKDDGGTMEVLVTPKMKVTITGKGDSSFLQPKAWVSSQSIVMANKELFGHKFTVHLGNAPPPLLKPDPNASEVYHISGQVVAANESGLTVNFGNAGGAQKVTYEEGATVEVLVSSTDHDLIAEGAKVEVEGITRGTKFLPSRLSVELEKPLTPDDIQAAANDKKGSRSKSAPTTRGSKKTGKAKVDEPAGDPIGTAADPFGVLGKKAGGNKKPAPETKDSEGTSE